MTSTVDYDATIVGAGPNGLAAAITIAQTGRSVLVLEAADQVGGGTRSAELTLPGFIHDVCSAIHPLALASPFLRSLPLDDYGLRWIQPSIPLAHPLDDGATFLYQDLKTTASELGSDGQAYRRLMEPLVVGWEDLVYDLLGPLRIPKHPLILARFSRLAIRAATSLADAHFSQDSARALIAGLAGHSMLPLERPITAAFALIEGMLGHAVGWPMAAGGSQSIANALADHLRSLGGQIVTGTEVTRLDELPSSHTTFLDLTPRSVLRLAGDQLPSSYRRWLRRYRYGPGVFKVDWALDGPIPWKAVECSKAATVHVGGSLEEIAESERTAWEGRHAERPFVILAQQSLFDPSRAPGEGHVAWGYCHVPHGSDVTMLNQIEDQIERFAPGFKDQILARATKTALEMERYNPNYVGGDINGGVQDLGQHFTRPAPRLVPYSTPVRGLYLCSSSTPPGGGVHGMCGHYAAKAALRRELK